MPPDLPNEQELTLKKRARRRLVGAVALVLLMIIILPQVLQDRATLTQQEPIKITMPLEANNGDQQFLKDTTPAEATAVTEIVLDATMLEPQQVIKDDIKPLDEVAAKNQVAAVMQTDKKMTIKTAEVSKVEVQKTSKPQESFTVQVGVYSDADNVKRLQEQLKQAGFTTYTEKVTTPKGDSLRLKAGHFNSRQDALTALAKIKEIGLSGIVIGNE